MADISLSMVLYTHFCSEYLFVHHKFIETTRDAFITRYGLTRKHFGNAEYEHVEPYHSWNSAHTATNWLLINLQCHSDHH